MFETLKSEWKSASLKRRLVFLFSVFIEINCGIIGVYFALKYTNDHTLKSILMCALFTALMCIIGLMPTPKDRQIKKIK